MQTLWQRILDYQIDNGNAVFPFSKRLQAENGWQEAYAQRVITEYKRFMYLVCVSPTAITPSDQVDQAWHLHMLYTADYWKKFCGEVLQREVHHTPTQGGKAERMKYQNLYAQTREAYLQHFQQEPPVDIWLPVEARFSPQTFERVNLDTHWVVRKPHFFMQSLVYTALGCLACLSLMSAAGDAAVTLVLATMLIGIGFIWVGFFMKNGNTQKKTLPTKTHKKRKKIQQKKNVERKKNEHGEFIDIDMDIVGGDSGCSSDSDSGGSSDSSGCSSGCGGGCGGGD